MGNIEFYKMKDFTDYLPPVYKNDYIKAVLNAIQIVAEEYFAELTDTQKEYFAATSDLMLEEWCLMNGIEYNQSVSLKTLQSNNLAKMKGDKQITEAVIKSIVESYAGGTCEVNVEHEKYTFYVKLTSKIGIPPKINEIRKVINKVKPAHLSWNIEFTYRAWKELHENFNYYKNKNYTWSNLKNKEIL